MEKSFFKKAQIVLLILVVSYFVISLLYQSTLQVGEVELRYAEKGFGNLDSTR